jgi:hypothetical protein
VSTALRYQEAAASFVPASDDNPDCIPFYRAFTGLRAVWCEDFCKTNHHIVHQAACHASQVWPEDAYRVALASVRDLASKMVNPPRPNPQYSYRAAPGEPTEADAYNLFKEEFKRAFPDKRVNSRFAKEKWNQKREKALEIVRERWSLARGRFDAEERKIQDVNDKQRQEWEARCASIAEFKAAVGSLPE